MRLRPPFVEPVRLLRARRCSRSCSSGMSYQGICRHPSAVLLVNAARFPRRRLPNLAFGASMSPLLVGDAELRSNSPDCRITPIASNPAGLLPDGNRPANRAATFARHTDVIKQLKQKRILLQSFWCEFHRRHLSGWRCSWVLQVFPSGPDNPNYACSTGTDFSERNES